MLQNSSDVALFSAIRGRFTIRLNCQKMLARAPRCLRDLKSMLDEIPLGVSQIGPIEPNITLVAKTIDS